MSVTDSAVLQKQRWTLVGLLSASIAISSSPAQQPVVQVRRRTEAGEAPRWQGVTTENTESI